LNILLAAIVHAVKSGAKGQFTFVGGEESEISALRSLQGVSLLEERGILIFRERVPRDLVWEILRDSDIGLSVAPPIMVYREMSPTKLAEYMGVGLAVLATKGIPLQEQFVLESGAGVLVDFNEMEIARAIIGLCSCRKNNIQLMKYFAKEYSRKKLRYELYMPELIKLISV